MNPSRLGGVNDVGVDGKRVGELADGRRWGLGGGTRCAWAVGFVVVWLLVRGVTWLLYVVGGRGGSVL